MIVNVIREVTEEIGFDIRDRILQETIVISNTEPFKVIGQYVYTSLKVFQQTLDLRLSVNTKSNRLSGIL